MKAPANEDCEALNRRYGAPGRIVFRPSRHNVPVVVIANQYGTAEVALLGAQTLSYRPTGHMPVLWMPRPYDEHAAGTEIHGGIPVCWPWFSRNGAPGSRPHGLARYLPWTVIGSEYSEEMSEVTLALVSDETTRALWPHDFRLTLKVSLSMKLTLGLRAENTGTTPFEASEGFHPYLRVRDRDACDVRGLDGFEYFSGNGPETERHVWTGPLPVRTGGSKVFEAVKYEYALVDSGLQRAIALVARGNSRLIVWNPGEERADEIAAFGPEGWRHFICVEPVVTPAYTLAPGETRDLLLAVQSTTRDSAVAPPRAREV